MADNSKDAVKKTGEHDHADPEYAHAMGQPAAAVAPGTLLKINHASAEQIAAYDKYFTENNDRLLSQLKELVAIPSLAMAPEHAPDVLKAAETGRARILLCGRSC